ncbi:metal-dependent hydrolase [Halarchaeum acidiphilum MH1-52-1]|uniref:Metal-dependent hydrolase n=1 Tax=Halarchaeum acidiphilum MH1-52-1 TaxID=1261545 RepID=U2YFL5_9EURY|nr:cyclase family protein [Halarchaeum acidiphilum]GAD52841.1 metal-dependent hydrolase [Halarchaeum acidiphilum MH1-52-1]
MPEWQDLTQPITERVTTHPPGWPYPEFEAYKSHESDGVNATRVRIVTHCGTHMDAPSHFFSADDHGTIEDVTPDEMVTEGVVLDLTDVDRGAAITPADLDAATEGNPIEDGDFVVLDTGMDPTETDEETYLREYAYPGVAAAEYLVDAGAAVVATDALGVDEPGASIADHEVHRALLPAGVRIVEGVANLGDVAYARHEFVCTPLPYVGRDGSQVRLLARELESVEREREESEKR